MKAVTINLKTKNIIKYKSSVAENIHNFYRDPSERESNWHGDVGMNTTPFMNTNTAR